MINLPAEALAEIQRAKASSGANNSAMELPPEVLAEIQGYKQQKMVKNKGFLNSKPVQSFDRFGGAIGEGFQSAVAKTILGAISALPDSKEKQRINDFWQPFINTFNQDYGDNSAAQGFSGALEALPYAAGVAETELPAGIANLASKAPRGLQTLAKMATGTLKTAPINAAYGALSYNPDKSTPEKALQGALVGTALKGAVSGLTGIASSASNTSQMILEALRTLKAEGVPVTASDVLGPGSILENFQKNVLPSFIGSGQATKFKNIINKVKGKGGDVINKLLGGEDIDHVLDNVISRVKTRFGKDSDESARLYGLVEEHINKNNIPYDDPITQNVAREELQKLDKNVAQEGPLLKNNELREHLAFFAKEPEKLDLNNLGDRRLTKEEAQKMLTGESALPRPGKEYTPSKVGKGKFYQLMQKEEDPHTRGVYYKLYKARKKDLRNIAEGSNDKRLKGLIEGADKFFKEDMAKYREKAVKPFLYDKKTPHDAFRTFVRSSVTENPQFLEKFTKLLEPEDKSRLAAYMFRDSINPDRTVNPGTFESTWNRIGNRTKNLLFNSEDRNAIQRIADLSKLSKTARGALDTPNTGVTALRGISSLASIASGGNALTSLMTGNLHGAMASGLPFIAAPIAQEVINNPAFLKAVALLKQAEEKGLLKKTGAPALTNIAVRQ